MNSVKLLSISLDEYEKFFDIQIKRRADWWAVFTVNKDEQVWPFVCYGLTPKDLRQYISIAEFPLLHHVAGNFLSNYDGGGRFFIDKRGVFSIKGESETGAKPQQFIQWNPDEPLPTRRTSSALNPESRSPLALYEEMQAMIERNRSIKRGKGCPTLTNDH